MGKQTKEQRENRTKMLLAFKRNAPHLELDRVSYIMDLLHRNDTTLNRINDTRCEVPMSDKETAAMEKKEAAAERRVTALVEELGFKVVFNGDPRGGAVRIILPDGSSNTWDGETWGMDW